MQDQSPISNKTFTVEPRNPNAVRVVKERVYKPLRPRFYAYKKPNYAAQREYQRKLNEWLASF